MEGIRLDQELVLKTSSGSNRCEFESHTFFILAYSVTVSTKHFDCFSLGSNPSKPTIIRVVEESGLSRWPWTLEYAGSNPAYPTNCPYNLTAKVLYF